MLSRAASFPPGGPVMSSPASLGFSADRLARLDGFLQSRYIDSGRLPGALTLIARGGEVAHMSVLGKADVERGAPLKEDTLFRIYSMTKPITSVAIMMLFEEGKIALDDPVEKYIPAWKNMGVYAAGQPGAFQTTRTERPMQVVDLLRHTSGLTYGFQNRTTVDATYRKLNVGRREASLETFVEELSKIPLEFSPGTAWNYSVSTDVLGYLVQVVSGMSFPQFLQTRLFDPLGMTDTGFQVRAADVGRFAACYNAKPGGGMTLADDPTKSEYLTAPVGPSGGGGLVSTASDYLKFTQMLLNGGRSGEVRYLSRKTIELMTANHLPGGQDLTQLSRSLFSEATNAGIGFGLGFAVNIDPPQVLVPGSYGEHYWGGAASTAFWIDPEEDLTVIFMTQLLPSSTYPIRRELRTLVYSALDD